MAITTLGAIALGAGALGSAALSSSAAGKASRAATQAADQSAQVQREQQQAAQLRLDPFAQRGNAAGNQINALLGLGGGQQMPQQQPAFFGDQFGGFGEQFGGFGEQFGGFGGQFGQFQQPMQTMQPQQTTVEAARAGFDQFRDSTGYQFRLGEGMNALNSQYAGAGVVKSGAAMRDAVQLGQNFASNEFGNYLNALGNQQGVGLSGASAVAGVGQNFANSMAQINDQRATGIGNAALANASNMNSLIGTLGAGILKYG